MRPLLIKELLALAPYILAAAVMSMMLVIDYAIEPTLLHGYPTLITGNLETWLMLGGALAFAAPHGAVGREFIDGHIEFVDALPVRRISLYVSKVLASLAVPLVLIGSTALVKAGALAIVEDPSVLPWGDLWSVSVLIYGAGILGFYGAGLLFAWFGELGWGLLALGMTGLSMLGELIAPLRPIGLFSGYASIDFDGTEPVVFVQAPTFWLLWAGGCVVLSGVAFLGPGERMLRGGARALPKMKRWLIYGCSSMLVLLALLLLAAQQEALVDLLALDTRQTATDRFRVLYLAKDETAALALVARASDIDDKVRALVGTERPSRLDIELGTVGRFHAGEFTGGKIRLALNEAAPSTLAHELAHAHAYQLLGRAAIAQISKTRFFSEGLAMWVEERVSGDHERFDRTRAWAAAIFAAEQHQFDLLMQDGARNARFDLFQVYPLGLVFTEALVDKHGAPAIGCVLSATSSYGTDRIRGFALWYGAFEKCGYDLDAVVDAYNARLARYLEQWPPPRPELTARPVRHNGVFLKVEDQNELDLDLVCRFRPRTVSPPAGHRVTRVAGGRCPVSERTLSGLSFWYQLGYVLTDGEVMYNEWVEGPVPPH